MGMRFHAEEGLVKNLICRKNTNNFALICRTASRLMLLGLSLVVILGLFTANASAQATDVYITPDGNATGNCTSNTHPPSWFNNSSDWGSASTQIGPGTIVHLCGTISTTLVFQASGAAGSPITLLFEPGAKISQPFCGSGGGQACLNLASRSFLTINGGAPCGPSIPEASCNGIIEATANGTSLANKNVINPGVAADGSSNIEFTNIVLRNVYIHSSPSDAAMDPPNPAAFHINGGSHWKIHHNRFHDMLWVVNPIAGGNPGQTDLEINDNDFSHFDHGVAVGVGTQNDDDIRIHDNHFHDTVNWDTTSNSYHHDGIHCYQVGQGGNITNIKIWNNLFDGNWGIHNTAFVYTEGVAFSEYLWNNVGIIPAGENMNNGAWTITVGPNGTAKAWNNTVVAASSQTSYVAKTEGVATDFRNNVTVGGILFNLITQHVSAFNNNIWQGSGQVFYNGTTLIDYPTFTASLPASSGQNAQGALTSSAGVSSTGAPNAGSVAIGKGANLSSLCTGDFVSLCKDTTNGGQRTATARPTSGPWDAGAFSSGGAVSSTPDPPNGLTAIIN